MPNHRHLTQSFSAAGQGQDGSAIAFDPYLGKMQHFINRLRNQLATVFKTTCVTELKQPDHDHHEALFKNPETGTLVASYTWSFHDNPCDFENGLRNAFYKSWPEGSTEQKIQQAAALAWDVVFCEVTFRPKPLHH